MTTASEPFLKEGNESIGEPAIKEDEVFDKSKDE